MKKINNSLNLIVFIGVIIILGTAGASDLENLSFSEMLTQMELGIKLVVFGKSGMLFLKVLKAHRQKKRNTKTAVLKQVKAA